MHDDRSWAQVSSGAAARLSLASPATVIARSAGEVTEAATHDMVTGAAVRGGLFCPAIFGDGRARFGHVALATPVAHPWFLWGRPSPLGAVLGLRAGDVERVLLGHAHLVTAV